MDFSRFTRFTFTNPQPWLVESAEMGREVADVVFAGIKSVSVRCHASGHRWTGHLGRGGSVKVDMLGNLEVTCPECPATETQPTAAR